MKGQAARDFLNFGLLIGVIIALNVVGNYVYKIWDFTEEKRYTLTDATENFLTELDEVVYVRVLLDGNLPSGFTRLRQSALETLKDFRSINPLIEFDFEDPTKGSTEKTNARKEELAENGIYPTNLRVAQDNETVEKLIYPYAILNIGDRSIAVNLLEAQGVGITDEVALNNSVSLLEYKFADAIQKLTTSRKPNILLTEGNGELRPQQTAALETILKNNYNIGRINLDSIYTIGDELDLLIMAGPTSEISQRSQFLIDQYVMKGGKVLWMIDYLTASLDSISKYGNYLPDIYPLGLEDMFFKYGVRIQPNLILDLESTRIPQVIGNQGGKAQQELIPYVYHPLVGSTSQHPIVKSIDRVNFFFPSTIDTIQTKANIHKEILLSSSNYSRFQVAPMRMNFEILRYKPDETKFDKGPQPIAVLLEGAFESFFKNRVSERMSSMLQDLGEEFKDKSEPTRMIFISDSDFAKNLYSPANNRISPLGFNQWEQFTFKGNQQFIFNAIEYLLDDKGLIAARGKDVKLRLLNKVKIQNERKYWQFLNIGLPLLFLIVLGIIYNFIRRRKYSRTDGK
ncbi:gliding motility-associated ABC transporter substrate-binding protein GldG [Portibacter lacus]|uniref:Gliding motility-associated ABC transporter substrate-binding protein GldG n=1 Tax=Portibacter lacus TaxID=1099794 RepID=A0AA37SUX5_9BACT|nr:gliding motility-associated ABC transporter substrate-binding protein GldG [Portibacter lacus]GLR20059.1 gliding motility-associated ABC transporter substrate-binding protein GldG [Portibacter lacus]